MAVDKELAIDWIPLSAVPRIVEKETDYLPTRQTVHNWAKSGKLQTNGYYPLRTTRKAVLAFLRTYKRNQTR